MAKDLFLIPLGGEGGGGEGTQGVQGPRGFQGTSGQNGLQGLQGYSGAQGTSGQNGLQGLQGYSGAQGTSGQNGLQGLQGYRGFQGPAGSGGGGSSDILKIEDMTSEQLGNLYNDPFYYQKEGYVCTYDGYIIIGGRFSEQYNAMELFSYTYPDTIEPLENGGYNLQLLFVDIVFDEGTGIYSLDYTDTTGTTLATLTYVYNGLLDKEDRLLAGDGIAIQSVTVGNRKRTQVSVVGGGGGSQGTQGVQGKQGVQGAFGLQGLQGYRGFQGIAGADSASSRLDVSQLSQAELAAFYQNYATEMASKELFWGPYPITSVRDYVYPVQGTPVTFRALSYRLEATYSSGGNPLVNTDMQLVAPDGTVWAQTGMSVELASYTALQGKQDVLNNTLQMVFTFTDSTQAVYDVYYK